MSQRILQLNELIRDHISGFIVKNVSLKANVFVTATKVDTSADLRYTRVFISVFPETESEYALRTLYHETKSLQVALHRKLATKPLPKLSFHLDTTEQEADKVEKILKSLDLE